jgi:uncharacterized repeat protein (TIGR01451 family)
VVQASAGANFTSKDYVVGQQPAAIVVYDFNKDGKLDIAVLNLGGNGSGNGTVSILLGNGDGTFQSAKTFDVGGPTPSTIAVADFNGDGKLDLAIGGLQIPGQPTCGASAVNILLGNGDGTFQPFQQAVSVALLNNLAAAGDLNGDGKADFVVYKFPQNADWCEAIGFSVFLGKGDGTFQPEQQIASGPLDFNGDGIPDLESSFGFDGPMTIFLGQGNGRYVPLTSGPEGNTGYITLGDFNNDNKQDQAVWAFIPCKGIFCRGGTAYVGIALGNGDGTFQPIQLFPPGGYPWYPGNPPSVLDLSPGDFNGDGKLDVAMLNPGPGFRVLLGKGDGTLPSLVNFDTGSGPITFVVADLNGDGRPDVVLANLNDGTISVALNTFPTTGADLAVTLTGNPSPVSVTQTLTYRATLQNQGPEDATNVVLTDTLPSGMNVGSASISAGSCSQANLVVTCNIAKLVSGDAALLTMAVIPTVSGTAKNSVSLTANETDENSANNTATVSTRVDPMFKLTVTKSGAGTGTISGGGGIDCGTVCTVALPTGTGVNIQASPSSGSGFGGWGGACGQGTAPGCDLVMSTDQTVTAEFDTLPNFTFGLNFSSITVQQGKMDAEVVNLYPEGPSFNSPIALTCTIQGAGRPLPTCSFSPSSVTLADASGGNSNLTIATIPPTAARAVPFGHTKWFYALSLPLLGLSLAGLRPRSTRSRDRIASALLFSTLLFAGLTFDCSCSGSPRQGGGGTPPGNYTVSMTGSSGATQHSTTVTLTVN